MKYHQPVRSAMEEKGATAAKAGENGGKEEAKEKAKEDECPGTFGPIITDTAIPIEKGRFAIQPTFYLLLSQSKMPDLV